MEDKSREGITMSKFLQLFRLILPRNTKTLQRLEKFTDLKSGKKKGLIIDVDECIAYNHGKILKENIEHIDALHKEGIRMVLFSNMKKTSRYDVLGDKVTVLVNVAPKPEAGGFLKAMKILDLPKKDIAMVGDNYITDAGAIRLGIDFIKIKSIKTKAEKFSQKLECILPNIMRAYANFMSRLHDLLRK